MIKEESLWLCHVSFHPVRKPSKLELTILMCWILLRSFVFCKVFLVTLNLETIRRVWSIGTQIEVDYTYLFLLFLPERTSFLVVLVFRITHISFRFSNWSDLLPWYIYSLSLVLTFSSLLYLMTSQHSQSFHSRISLTVLS